MDAALQSVKSSAPAVRGVSASGNNTGNTLNFYDEPLSTLAIHKYITGTDNQPLPGVTFKVVDGSGANVGNADGIYVTDDSGDIVIPNLEQGTVVKVREIRTAAGYIPDGTPQDIEIRNSELHELTFYNAPEQTLTIRKFAADTSTPLSGVTFHVTGADGENIGSSNGDFITDRNGEIVISGLTPGETLTVKETRTASGYVLDSTPQTVKIQSGEGQTLTLFNAPKGSLTVVKRDKFTDWPLPGAEFRVTTAKGEAVPANDGLTSTNGFYVTDAHGQFTISGLLPGAYVVTETMAPEGYVLDSAPQTVTVEANDAQTLTFRDAPKQSLTIYKFASGTFFEPLPGVTFKVTDDTGAGIGPNNGVYYTDWNGEIFIENLTPGTSVTVRETATVDGYILDGTPQTVRILEDEAQELVFWNQPKGSLIVRKIDAETGDPIFGAEFGIFYADGRPVDQSAESGYDGPFGPVVEKLASAVRSIPVIGNSFTTSSGGHYFTNDMGEIVINGVTGTITVTELNPAEGYAIDPENRSKTVTVSANDAQTLVFSNPRLLSLTIHKRDSLTKEPLADAEFSVKDSGGAVIGTYSTGEDGTAVVPGLTPNDTVVVTEKNAPAGYVKDTAPKTVKVQSGRDNSVTFENTPTQTLTVQKYEKGTTNPISGAAFFVSEDGKPVGESNGEYLTDENGRFVLTDLTPGANITVKEIRAAEGYVLDGTSKTIKIKSSAAQSLTFYNTPEQRLIIRKYVTDSTTPIPGVTFHITDTDGQNIGGSNGDFVTDSNGEIVISGLLPGVSVVAKETRAASGYVLDSTPQTLKIRSGETQTMVFYNAPKGGITIVKLDAVTGQPLSGAEFKITTIQGEPLDDFEGQVSTGGMYRTNENGEIVLLNVQPGTYRVAETAAPDGYVLDAPAQTVTVNANDTQTVTFRDTALQTVVIRKYVDGTTTPLPGVTFSVTDANGTKIGAGEYVTDANGEIAISSLAPGMTLIVREVKTVRGYALNGTPRTIVVGVDVALQSQGAASGIKSSGGTGGNTATFYDEPLSILVLRACIEGTDSQPLPGVTFKVMDGSGRPVGSSDGIFVTDDSGEIVIPELEAGTVVKAREIKTVDGYVLNGTPQDVFCQGESER